jgi:hypothetical protein
VVCQNERTVVGTDLEVGCQHSGEGKRGGGGMITEEGGFDRGSICMG